MLLSSELFGVVLAIASIVTCTAASHVLHERRDVAPRHWLKKSKLGQHAILPMRIGMRQSNIDRIDELLMEVSRHDSPKYGMHYSADEVTDLFAPSNETVDAVRGWLEAAGIATTRISQSSNRQWMQFDASTAEAEQLLKTSYHVYEHATGKTTVACDEYHVPDHIQAHVDYVTPGIKLGFATSGASSFKNSKETTLGKRGFRTGRNHTFGGPVIGKKLPHLPKTSSLVTAAGPTTCDSVVTPECIAAFYNITPPRYAAPRNQLGIFEEGDFYATEDLVEFFTTFTPQIPPTTTPTLNGIDGGFAPGEVAGGESDLDIQISYPIVYPQGIRLFQTDDIFYALGVEGEGGFLNTFFDAIDGSYCTFQGGDDPLDPHYPDPNPAGYQGQRQCGVYTPTSVISISYGEQEDDLPTAYQQRQCAEIAKLGMQGVSIVLASGDSGVSARGSDDGNDDGCLGNGEVFSPDFPASCPYVTAVGATFLPPGGNANSDEEVAVTRFPSGGGFSNIYPAPSYQAAAIQTYLTDYPPSYPQYPFGSPTNNPPESVTNGGLFNAGGRGYPDVSAIGDNVIIINNGVPTLIGGTSASAPVFASILNRINEERIAVGKGTVGFVNPVLYEFPFVLHDIVTGTNPGCNTNGFSAAPGWDPVTGLGTPNYPAMKKLFLSLPHNSDQRR